MDPAHRIETDSLGAVRVPAGARWGAQTQRAVENFVVSGRRVDPDIVHALATIKTHAAEVNGAAGRIDSTIAGAIADAAREVSEGRWDDEFPVDVFQTGSGTSTNMNVNEVVANIASQRCGVTVHPNDHVNHGQSSNDTFPSAVRIAVALAVRDHLLGACRRLSSSLGATGDRLGGVVKAGRTHLMDATPVTLGQEFRGYAAQIDQAIERIEAVLPRLCRLPLGGTATGTGLNAPEGFAGAVIAALAAETGLGLVEAPDHFAAQGSCDDLVEMSGAVRVLAVALTKIANDLRWMASGPATGLAEITLPELQPGSSIMPGKVNPVICETVTQVAARVFGHDATVGFAGSQGSFELNTYQPVIADALLDAVKLCAAACRLLAGTTVDGLTADEARCRRYAESTPALATALAPVIGYDEAASVVKEALRTGATIISVVVERGLMGESEARSLLDVEAMTRPGIRGSGD
ncbi:MAG: class II fumarate hydratase [Acidimicrobiales bacterium]